MQTTEYAGPDGTRQLRGAEKTFQRALVLHQQGNDQAAAALYEQTVSLDPAHAGACFYLGLLYDRQGDSESARSWLERAYEISPYEPAITYQFGIISHSLGDIPEAKRFFSKTLALDPSHWQAAYNLGTSLFALGQVDDAINAYHKAASHNPQDPDIHFNLGLAYIADEKPEKAVCAYLCALEIAPDDAEIHYNMALAHKKLDEIAEAVSFLEIAVALAPDFAPAFGHLGVLYLEQGRVDDAVSCYQRLVDLDYNTEAAQHILSALRGETTEAAPASYVKDLFDNFSDSFEERLLADLEYRTPLELKELLENAGCKDIRCGRLLDLGCGTGLVGEVFAECMDHVDGVDISEGMVAQAAAKGIYWDLHVEEIVEYLQTNSGSYDLIVAADVFVYLGDLDEILSLVAHHLTAEGKVLFSVEHSDGNGFELRPSGRYAHSSSYINEIVKKNGLAVLASRRTNLRKEKGEWITGELYLLSV